RAAEAFARRGARAPAPGVAEPRAPAAPALRALESARRAGSACARRRCRSVALGGGGPARVAGHARSESETGAGDDRSRAEQVRPDRGGGAAVAGARTAALARRQRGPDARAHARAHARAARAAGALG